MKVTEKELPEIKFREGNMMKRPTEMTSEELKNWDEKGQKEIREYLFSINQPLVYKKDGNYVTEDKHGNISII